MQIVYDLLPEREKAQFTREHPRGWEILRGIESDLSRDPYTRATVLGDGRFAQIFSPEIAPPIEVRVAYLVGDKILVKVFRWLYLT